VSLQRESRQTADLFPTFAAPATITLDTPHPTNDKEPSVNTRNPTQKSFVPSPALTPTHLNVFTVEEYESNGKTGKRWTKIGAAFPHNEGSGFSVELRAFPVDGRLVVLPPDPTDDTRSQ
jgi:hypothetical protein